MHLLPTTSPLPLWDTNLRARLQMVEHTIKCLIHYRNIGLSNSSLSTLRNCELLCYAYNATPYSSIGYSPHYLMFCIDPKLPVDFFLPNI